ncbi:hypothetical protein CANCADRAFT_1590 [Tortispora caseinolytica NRRL Y-17796]|uniref:Uncharacterized protein n=1 Tax=Tortispora caseinolytica NRRL Y-17796 TaxID=767744 RepID=A0A1E4TDL0_9ASCO|nr:hypothetical protein CANCADRAFT_1590 [Tortispora caseinolytica NRRL Y-17796]
MHLVARVCNGQKTIVPNVRYIFDDDLPLALLCQSHAVVVELDESQKKIKNVSSLDPTWQITSASLHPSSPMPWTNDIVPMNDYYSLTLNGIPVPSAAAEILDATASQSINDSLDSSNSLLQSLSTLSARLQDIHTTIQSLNNIEETDV